METQPMPEMEQFNLKFIKLIKNKQCLWKQDSNEYCKKAAVKKAWSEIAKEMGESTIKCHSRWRGLRRAYKRSLSVKASGKYQQREYYLSKHLEFVRPFVLSDDSIRFNASSSTNNNKEDNEVDNSSHCSEPEDEIKEEPIESDSEIKFHEESIEKLLLDINKKENSDNDDDDMQCDNRNSFYNKRKRQSCTEPDEEFKRKRELDDNDVHSSSGPSPNLIEANRKFFDSLLPFIDDMTPQQNRRFRRNIMCLIDDILDNRDIENNTGC